MTSAQAKAIDIGLFRDYALREGRTVFDVRSPAEYAQAHFPGAHSLPLLNDEERAIVGTTYKKEGKDAAVLKGFELVGNKFLEYIQRAVELNGGKGDVLVYCWRGGMRSNIMAWLLELYGFRVCLLEGGYKTYRHWCLHELAAPRQLLVLSGATGTGKTALLHALRDRGEAVLDIEGIGHHRGSSFGALGQPDQPSQEAFENNLAESLHTTAGASVTWVEDESRFLGKLRIPDVLFNQMTTSAAVVVGRPRNERIRRILEDYGHFDPELLKERTLHLRKRMGDEQVRLAVQCLEEGDQEGWVEELLKYYDKAYAYSFERESKDRSAILHIPPEEGDVVAALVEIGKKL